MACSEGLYCSPEQDELLYPDTNYTLAYNPQFGSLNGASNVDLYLYNANQSNFTVIEEISSVSNDGQFNFTVDMVQ
jgi:hypothetical protein